MTEQDKTIWQDLNSPLIDVERAWLRRTVLIGMLPFVIILSLPFALVDWIFSLWTNWIKDTW